MVSMGENYSVLMSVYYKEKPEYLRESMQSIYEQTIPTDDFVLICDGPLNEKLDAVIHEMQKKFKKRLKVYQLENNGGLGNALNIGIHNCKNELIARMDSDDISRPDRCERELNIFKEKPDIAIVSGIVEEFDHDKDFIQAKRVLPEYDCEIKEFARFRNPFNHPCIMYKKSQVEIAGGYRDFYLLEDYFLWIRMFQCGCKGYNIQSPLLWMRTGSELYKRRGGWKYAMSQKALFQYMAENNYIGKTDYYTSIIGRTIISIMPNPLREFFYKEFVRG